MTNIKEPSLKIREEIDPIMFHLFSNVTAIEWQESSSQTGIGEGHCVANNGNRNVSRPTSFTNYHANGNRFNPWSPCDGLNDIQIVDLMETDGFHTLLFYNACYKWHYKISFLLWWIWIHGAKRGKKFNTIKRVILYFSIEINCKGSYS